MVLVGVLVAMGSATWLVPGAVMAATGVGVFCWAVSLEQSERRHRELLDALRRR
jgi:nitrogen fixation-related uncharacterized protein